MVPKMLGKKNYSISFHPLMNRHLPVKMGIYIYVYILIPCFLKKHRYHFSYYPKISPLYPHCGWLNAP